MTTKIPGNILQACKNVSENEWSLLFDAFIVETCMRLPACLTADDRLRLQAEVTGLQNLKSHFLSELRRK